MKKHSSNNKGLSLVELIVVVAILGIVSLAATNNLSLLHITSTKETAQKLNSALNKARVEAMSRSQASVKIYKENSDYYVVFTKNKTGENTGIEESPVKIGNSRVKITYTTKTGNAESSPQEIPATGLTIAFDRETGGLKPLSGNGTDEIYFRQFIVTSGSKTIHVVCEKLTGKIKTE